jgi:hypothetical protein
MVERYDAQVKEKFGNQQRGQSKKEVLRNNGASAKSAKFDYG